MIEYGQNIWSQNEVSNLFHTKYPETPVAQLDVIKIYAWTIERGDTASHS